MGHKLSSPVRRPDPFLLRVKGGADSLSGNAGLVLFARFAREIGLDEALHERFGHVKDPLRSVYPLDQQIRLLLDMYIAGEPRVMGLESLARDAVFVRLNGGFLPSIDTLYRDLNNLNKTHVNTLTKVMVQHGLRPVRRLSDTDQVHLDIDSTAIPMFGQQQGAVIGYNPRYRGRPSYHPLTARCAETRTWVGGQLRPGNTSFGSQDGEFVKACVESVRAAIGARPLLWVRIDAAGDCAVLMKAVHDTGSVFVTRAHMTQDLREATREHRLWQTVEVDADGRPDCQVAEIEFRRSTWGSAVDLPVRVIAIRRRERDVGKQVCLWLDDDWSVDVYLSNELYHDPLDIAEKYNKRSGIEPLIAEVKNDWGAGAMSSGLFSANAATFVLKLLAHNLLRCYADEWVPAIRDWRSDWIRRVVINVPGKLVHSGRVWTIKIPSIPVLMHLLE
jgi:hypothetical protein